MDNIDLRNFRAGPFGNALAFFDIVIDNALTLNGMVLKAKTNSEGYFYQEPGKLRLETKTKCGECGQITGTPAKNKEGYNIYDNHFGLQLMKPSDAENWKPTEDAFEFRSRVLSLAVAAYEQSQKKTGAVVGVGTATTDGEALTGSDDDLPFN